MTPARAAKILARRVERLTDVVDRADSLPADHPALKSVDLNRAEIVALSMAIVLLQRSNKQEDRPVPPAVPPAPPPGEA